MEIWIDLVMVRAYSVYIVFYIIRVACNFLVFVEVSRVWYWIILLWKVYFHTTWVLCSLLTSLFSWKEEIISSDYRFYTWRIQVSYHQINTPRLLCQWIDPIDIRLLITFFFPHLQSFMTGLPLLQNFILQILNMSFFFLLCIFKFLKFLPFQFLQFFQLFQLPTINLRS